jgi:hypothetical protein
MFLYVPALRAGPLGTHAAANHRTPMTFNHFVRTKSEEVQACDPWQKDARWT